METVQIEKQELQELKTENQQLKKELSYLQDGTVKKLLQKSSQVKKQLQAGKKYGLLDI